MAVAAAAAESPAKTDSPRSPKPALLRSTPWAQVVRGAVESLTESSQTPAPERHESSPAEAPLEPEKGNVAKKAVWNKPVNGVSAQNNDSGGSDNGVGSVVVMGGPASWPALSESARLSQKAAASLASTVAPVSPKRSPEGSQVPPTSNSQKGNASANHNSSIDNIAPVRQRSMKRGGDGGNRQGGYMKGLPPTAPLPVFPIPDTSHSSFAKGVQMVGPDFSLSGARPAGGFGSQPGPSNEHSNHRSANRRGGFRHRGKGVGRNSYQGARGEVDQGNHEWSSSNMHRGAHGHPQRPGRSFVGPSVQGPTFFAPPPHLVPYGPTLGYPDMQYMYVYPIQVEAGGGILPFFAPGPPPPYFVDSALHEKVVRQIDYYFSDDNLAKDEFLKSKMNEEGWVSIGLIANFPRVQSLKVSTPDILDFLRASTVVEVKGDNIRRRDDWSKWVPIHRSSVSSSSSRESSAVSHDNLVNSLEKVSLDDKNHQGNIIVEAQTVKEMSGELPVSNMEATIQHVC